MATKTAPENPAAMPAAEGAAPPRSGLVKTVVIVTVLIVAEACITFFLMPKASSAKPEPTGKTPAAIPVVDDNDAPDRDAVEVAVGDFNCTNNTASRGVVIHVDFKLACITASGKSGTLEGKLKSHQTRIRQLVSKIIRKSGTEDLNDPNLGTIKREIREEINRLLHQSLVEDVVISDVRTMEQ